MKTCDVCNAKLGILKKFRYTDGYICKECYKKASRQYTETVARKSLSEIKRLCSKKIDEESYSSFEVTGKIGNYLLVDEKNGRICLPNNRAISNRDTEPDFFDIEDIEKCEIEFGNEMSLEELEGQTLLKKSEDVVRYLKVAFTLKGKKRKSIDLLSNPVRIKSYAFRQSFEFAKRINEEVNRLIAV